MSDDLWQDAVDSLRGSQAFMPLRRLMEAEYEKRKEQLVSENTDVNCGKALELRKWLKDLFSESVDTHQ